MKLGGFVIHGDRAATLGACLESLTSVCDEVVAVDCAGSEEASAIARRAGVRTVFHRWEGYGAARAAAVRALHGCDYAFFLDSDEWLGHDAIGALGRWKRSSPRAPYYRVKRRDWAALPGRSFVYRTERHVRLVRMDAARWEPAMIVHEALPPAAADEVDATIEHLFATSVDAMLAKCERYALLWALRFGRSRRRVKSPTVQHAFHMVRELLFRGALFRGGRNAISLANAVARHHARKYRMLAQVRAGAHGDLAAAFEEGRYAEVFARIAEHVRMRDPMFAAMADPDRIVESSDRGGQEGVPDHGRVAARSIT